MSSTLLACLELQLSQDVDCQVIPCRTNGLISDFGFRISDFGFRVSEKRRHGNLVLSSPGSTLDAIPAMSHFAERLPGERARGLKMPASVLHLSR